MVHGSLGHLPFMLGNLALHFSLSSSKLCTTEEKERDQTVLKQYKLQTTDFYLLNEQILKAFHHNFYDNWLQLSLNFTYICKIVMENLGNQSSSYMHAPIYWLLDNLIHSNSTSTHGISPTNYWIPERIFWVDFITRLLIHNAIFATENFLSSSFYELSESPISFYGLYGLISG